MISVKEAQSKIQENSRILNSVSKSLENALDQVLSDDVKSPIHMPPFSQSAMDGYAIGSQGNTFKLVGEIQAGADSSGMTLKSNEAVRIFTGAMIPNGTFAVAKQEIVEKNKTEIRITEKQKHLQNIRPLGEQIKKGDIALPKGTVITPGTAGFLYTLGVNQVSVTKKPNIIILSTGNELVPPGQELSPGKIYESNTYTLKTALKKFRIQVTIKTVEDNYEATKKSIQESLNECDILITTGGISVGDYDFVGKAMEEVGVESIFYKIKQKPGKPIFFGKRNSTVVFGLPGNPAAALSCFYLYVTPGIRKMCGISDVALEKRTLKLTSDYTKSKNLTHFLKAKCYGDKVAILGAQSSAMLSSFASANCLACLPEGQSEWKKGDAIEVYILP